LIELTLDKSTAQKFDPRDATFNAIAAIMKKDADVFILTNDFNAFGLDEIRKFAKDRVVNTGITEQNMISVAAGMALSGKTVFVFGIAAHLAFRGLEQIKLDVCVQNLPVIFVVVGAGLAYGPDGPTHQGVEDISVLRSLPNISIYNPADYYSIDFSIRNSYESQTPSYVRLDKEVLPQLYHDDNDIKNGLIIHQRSKVNNQGIIFATGITVWLTLKTQELLKIKNIDCIVVDIYKIKPINIKLLKEILSDTPWALVVEEAIDLGCLGELIAKHIDGGSTKLSSINLGDEFLLGSSNREWVWNKYGFNPSDIVKKVLTLDQNAKLEDEKKV
jgi:transketolase